MAAGTPYILPMVAALRLRQDITRLSGNGTTAEDLDSLAFHLRYAKCQYAFLISYFMILICVSVQGEESSIGTLIQKAVIPQTYWVKSLVLQTRGHAAFQLVFHGLGEGGADRVVAFDDILQLDLLLDAFKAKYVFFLAPISVTFTVCLYSTWTLPQRSELWNIMRPDHPYVHEVISLYSYCLTPLTVAETIELTTPLDLQPTPCPVNPENSESWTALQRETAKAAVQPSTIQELEEQVKH